MTGNPYLAYYRDQLAHQEAHGSLMPGWPGRPPRPLWSCVSCLVERRQRDEEDVRRRYSWAVPDNAALDAIARHAPRGVVEVGAGAGYWAGLLRGRGVDVIAYDPAPPGSQESRWHTGHAWSDVLLGDHTAALGHPTRTLLMVWPSYDEPWGAEALSLFGGDTVVYVGEGAGGCTGDDDLHALLGEESGCWCAPDDCDCKPAPAPLYRSAESVAIPQWEGLNDYLTVYARR